MTFSESFALIWHSFRRATLRLQAKMLPAWANRRARWAAMTDDPTHLAQIDRVLEDMRKPKPVAGVPESNWLPSAEGKPFSLTFRTYVPKDIVRRGDWVPPAVTRVD
jgi:hypothetical protein